MDIAAAHAAAPGRFRAGDAHAEFPPYTFRPPLPMDWRAAGPRRAAAGA